MIQRILTALVLIPLVLLLILRAPKSVLAVVACCVALLAIREFLDLVKHYGIEPFSWGTYVFAGLSFAFSAGQLAPLGQAFFLGLAPFIFLAAGMKRGNLRSIYPAAAASVFAFTYIALPMGMLVRLNEFNLVYLMLVVWSGDIFAYFVGKSLGKHKMSPRISPGKTWEGAVASLLASVGFGTMLYNYSHQIGHWLFQVHLLASTYDWDLYAPALWKVILLSTALNVAAQLGDLVESAIKRGADVKDSGSILPGHGGMLDRIDALLFAAPILWIGTLLLALRFGPVV